MEFRIGDKYNRLEELADFGGTWQSGIITSKDNPYVFIITGQVVKDHGYENKFLDALVKHIVDFQSAALRACLSASSPGFL